MTLIWPKLNWKFKQIISKIHNFINILLTEIFIDNHIYWINTWCYNTMLKSSILLFKNQNEL